jgi:tape measure domain-containing protein
MAQQVGVLEIMLMANMAKLSQDMRSAERVVGDATSRMERHIASAKNAMSGLGMGVGLAAMTDQLRRATDAYVKLDAQVRINTKSQEQYNQALGDIRRIANTAQADIAATSMLYTRLKSTMEGTGTSMKQIATVTETVTYGLKAYGATSAEAASASLQLSQAMGSGRLGGEEFRAVMEAMPNVMKVLAESMGVPLGRLRELSIAGEITAEQMLKAFGNEAVAEQFRKLAMESMTITGAFQVLRNEFMLYIGEAGKTSGVTASITSSIMFLAENLKLVGQMFLLSAAIMAGKYVAAITSTVKAYGTLAIAQGEALAMNVALAESKVAELATTQAQIVAVRELAVADLAAANSAAARAAATTELALLGEAQAKVTQRQAAATAELTAATALNASTTVSGATSVGAALRALGVAISTFVVAHPILAVATAIGVVITAISNWETVVKATKATFEWLKDAFNAIHFAAASFGIAMGNMAMQFKYFIENKSKLFSTDAKDRAAFSAEIKRLDDLAKAQKQQVFDEISGHNASVKAAEDAAIEQAKVNQKALDDFRGMHLTKEEQRQDEIKKLNNAYALALRSNKLSNAEQIVEAERYRVKLGEINAKYDRAGIKAAESAANKRAAAAKKLAEEERKWRESVFDSMVAEAENIYKENEAIEKNIVALEFEIKTIGKTKEEKALLTAERYESTTAAMEEKLAIIDLTGQCTAESEALRENIRLRKMQRDLNLEKASAEAAYEKRQDELKAEKEAIKEIEKVEKNRWKMVDDLAHDTFMNIALKGKNAFSEIGASIKKYVLEMLYQMTVQKWLINIGLTGMGSMAAGAAQAAGLATGASGLSDTGSMMSIGSSLANMAGGGSSMYGAFATSGMGQALGLSQMSGGMSVAATEFAGMTVPAAEIAGTAELTSLGATLGSVAAAAPYILAAIAIADAVGAFGKRGGPQQGQYGRLDASGYRSSFTMSGGDALNNPQLASAAYAQAQALFAIAGKNVADLAIEQGYKLDPQGSAAGLAYRNLILGGKTLTGGTFDGNNGAQWTGSNSDAAGAANFLGKLNTAEIVALVKEIADPKLSAAADALMKNFGELENSLPAYITAQEMQKAMTFSLMTETEKTAEKTRRLDEAFKAVGLSVPASTSAFKEMVFGIDITTEAGQKQLAALNQLGAAFLELHPEVEKATANTEELTKQMSDVSLALAELDMSPLEKSLNDIARATSAAIEKASKLSATEEQLSKIRELGAKQANALIQASAVSAYTNLMSETGDTKGAAAFTAKIAEGKYTELLGKLAESAGITSEQAQAYIASKGGITPAVKAYWDELDEAMIASTDPRRTLLIQLAEAAAEMTKTQAAANEAAAKSTETIARQTETTVDNSAALQLAAQRRQLEIALMEAQGNRAGALAERRKDELAAMDESLRGMQSAIWAAQDAAEAAQAAREAAQAAREAAERNLAAARSATDSAMDAVRRAIDAQRKIAQSAVDTAREHVSAIKSVMDAISEGVKSLRGSVTSSVVQSGVAGMQFISNALENAKSSGYLPDANDLKTAISASTAGLDAKLYTSRVAEDRDRLRLAAQLEALGVISGDQLTAADKALALAERQLADLDAQLAMAQAQLDALRGIDTRILSVSAAIAALGVAIAAERAMTSPATVQPLGGAAVSTVGGGGDVPTVNAELEANKLIVAGMSATQYANAAAALKETAFAKPGDPSYEAITSDPRFPGFAIGTSYVPYDMVAPIHEGEEITPRPYVDEQKAAREQMNALLQKLCETSAITQADIADIKRTNRLIFQIEDKWDIDGMPQVRA